MIGEKWFDFRHGPKAKQNGGSLRLPVDVSAALIFMHELSRKIIGKGSHLERRATAAGVDCMQLDPIKGIIGKDRDDLARLELGSPEQRAESAARQPTNWRSRAFMSWSWAAIRNAVKGRLPKYG